MPLTLSVLPGEYAVCRLSPAQALPGWATSGELFSVTRTPDELSVVCSAQAVPADVQQAAGWTALRLHGPFDFGLTGILAGVLNPLHRAGVGIFALSTFDTDYVLVKREKLDAALRDLRAAGHTVLGDAVVDAAERE